MRDLDRRELVHLVGAGLASALLLGPGGLLGAREKKTRVVLVKGDDPARMLAAAMKVFRGMGAFVKGKKVVLKPNMGFRNPPSWGNNTSPAVAVAVAALCKASGARGIMAVDHTMGAAGRAIKACGVGPALESLGGVTVASIHHRADYIKRRLPRAKQLKTAEVFRGLSHGAVLINVPVAKQHVATRVSLGLKNLMGLVWDRHVFHELINLHQGIADLATLVTPALTVIDATRVMTSNGPQGPGKVEVLNTLVVSNDPVAADTVALGLTRWDRRRVTPAQVAHLKYAALLGIGQGDLTRIKIIKKRV